VHVDSPGVAFDKKRELGPSGCYIMGIIMIRGGGVDDPRIPMPDVSTPVNLETNHGWDSLKDSSYRSVGGSCTELPGKGNSNSHGARPVHLIIKMIKWIRTSRLSKKNFVSLPGCGRVLYRGTSPRTLQ